VGGLRNARLPGNLLLDDKVGHISVKTISYEEGLNLSRFQPAWGAAAAINMILRGRSSRDIQKMRDQRRPQLGGGKCEGAKSHE